MVAIKSAFAEDFSWPNSPLKFIVPFAAGGNTDLAGRVAAAYLQNELGQPILVENKAGAGGVLGADFVAKSRGDGKTFLIGSAGALTFSPLIEGSPYDPLKDFLPISLVSTNPLVLIQRRGLGLNTVQQLVDYAKANPGVLTYGSSGVGGLLHMAAILFESLSGARLNHIPFRGGAPAVSALVSGELDLIFANISEALAQIRSGEAIPIGVTANERISQLPDVPTMAEGGISNCIISSWNGLLAPNGTSVAAINRLAAACEKMAKDPAARSKITDLGSLSESSTPPIFAKMLGSELERWGRTIRSAGMETKR
jgi:tripartite-type tricarboxylate transporter receptor subunit TctC